ncbi:hypothetical protein CO678_26715 [Bradyrhizobium diazoefficiens]|nr:hypothetical protein CO678_26715 [Bradyrhizobium diazoefficiens]
MQRPDRARASAIRKATGAIVHRSPGRARHKPSNHCAGKAVCWASPVCRCADFVATFRTVDRGCPAGTRPSLRPLTSEGVAMKQSSGEASREDTKVCLQGRRMGRALAKPIMLRRAQKKL